MSSTRVSNRLRAKRFKAGTATAEDKAYLEAKYDNLVKPTENITTLKQKATVEQSSLKKKSSHIVFDSDEEFDSDSVKIGGSISKAKKAKAQAKFEEDMSKIVLEKERCETLMKEAVEVKKPTLIIEEDDEDEKEQEKFRDQCAIDSLIQERRTMINSLYRLNQEIERLEKKWAEPKVIPEITPEKFRNVLSDLGYIKK
jgi:hypothetical protein